MECGRGHGSGRSNGREGIPPLNRTSESVKVVCVHVKSDECAQGENECVHLEHKGVGLVEYRCDADSALYPTKSLVETHTLHEKARGKKSGCREVCGVWDGVFEDACWAGQGCSTLEDGSMDGHSRSCPVGEKNNHHHPV